MKIEDCKTCKHYEKCEVPASPCYRCNFSMNTICKRRESKENENAKQ